MEDPEDFLSLVSVAQEYLTHRPLQTAFITSGGITTFHSVFETANSRRFESESLDNPELSSQVSVLQKVLINALSDITDNPAFAQTHPISSPVFAQLVDWLNSPNPALQSAACLALGNLARDDDSSLSLINTYTIHTHIIKILSDPSNTNTLLIHAALGFLKNLAIPPQNKHVLGPLLLSPDALPRIWAMDALPQVHLAAASLTRMLLVDTPENVELLCSPSTPTNRSTTTDSSSPTIDSTFHKLLALFDKTDDPAKTETARAVLRVVRSPLGSTSHALYDSYPHISDAISHLITQTRWPALRSETISVLAQASRSEAALPMLHRLFSRNENFAVLGDAVKGIAPQPEEGNDSDALAAEVMRAGAEQAAATAARREGANTEGTTTTAAALPLRADQENSLIIVWNLILWMKQGDGEGIQAVEGEQLKSVEEFEELMKEGGSLLGSKEEVSEPLGQ